jgi:hypothetical protein
MVDTVHVDPWRNIIEVGWPQWFVILLPLASNEIFGNGGPCDNPVQPPPPNLQSTYVETVTHDYTSEALTLDEAAVAMKRSNGQWVEITDEDYEIDGLPESSPLSTVNPGYLAYSGISTDAIVIDGGETLPEWPTISGAEFVDQLTAAFESTARALEGLVCVNAPPDNVEHAFVTDTFEVVASTPINAAEATITFTESGKVVKAVGLANVGSNLAILCGRETESA